MKIARFAPLAVAALAALAVAAPAAAAPTAKDARAAIVEANGSLARSLASAESAGPDAIADLAEARRLQARAVRITNRASAGRSLPAQARLLRSVTALVDGGFGSYADLLGRVPPELQPYVLDALERLETLRAQLIADLTDLVDALPSGARDQVVAAVTAFGTDGDLEALIAALSDPSVSGPVLAQLQTFVAQITATLQAQADDLGDLAQILPPDAADGLQAAVDRIQEQLASVLTKIQSILDGDDPQLPELPPLPSGLCGQLETLLQTLGLPLPAGFCTA